MRVEEKVKEALCSLGQSHLFSKVEQLSPEQLGDLFTQLQKYSPSLAKMQRELLSGSADTASRVYEPCRTFERSGNSQDEARGKELIALGKVGCLIMAGGQGTRLGYNGPKGAVPVTPLMKKSLFQLLCERTKAAGALAGRILPLAVMTSAQNHDQTVAFFEEHAFFGLEKSQVSFFEQEMLPFLDDDGHWFFEETGKIAEGPDGNGHALHLFYKTGIWKKWKELGVDWLHVIFVDNALADPFDPEFTGFTQRKNVDAALKAVERLSPQEKMGVLAMRESAVFRLKVIEYSELPADSSLYTLSNTGMFCFSMDFIHRLCHEIKPALPLHIARKTTKAMVPGSDGKDFQKEVHAWKCERFIFDVLDAADSNAVLVCPRENIYAPLKNATGEKSLETVRQALLHYDQRIYQTLTGVDPGICEFELDPVFYYPSDALRRQLKELPPDCKDYVSVDYTRDF